MKRSSHCGKEYPDEVLVCVIDQQLLKEAEPSLPANAPLLVESREKSEVISFESVLIKAIVIIIIICFLFSLLIYLLFRLGVMRDHGL